MANRLARAEHQGHAHQRPGSPEAAYGFRFNLLNLGQNWISSKQVSFGGLMLGLHGGVLLLTLFWLIKSHNNWQGWSKLKRSLSRRAKAQT